MVIKYHTLRLLNDILPPEIRDSDTQLQWLKSLINPIKERQDELNINQDIILRDQKHNGQQGVIDHMINKIQYPDISGDVFFKDKDIIEELILYTDNESPATQPYIYTDDEVISGITTNYLYLITDEETGYVYSSFEVLIPDMYEDTDTQYGVEYWVNKYKPAGKTFDTYFFSGSTTENYQSNFTNFGTFDEYLYISTQDSFIRRMDTSGMTIKSVITFLTGFTSDNFNFSNKTTNSIYAITDTFPSGGLASTTNFSVTSGNVYIIEYNLQLIGEGGGDEVASLDSPVKLQIVKASVVDTEVEVFDTGEGFFTWTGTSSDNFNFEVEFDNTHDYEGFYLQVYMKDITNTVTFTEGYGYQINFDVVQLTYGNDFISAAEDLVYISGTTGTTDTYTKYTGATYLGSTDATYYNFDYVGINTGSTINVYKATNYSNLNGGYRIFFKENTIENVSGLTAKLKNGDTTVAETTINGDTYWYPDVQDVATIALYLEWINETGIPIIDINISFETNIKQSFNMNLIDNNSNVISDVSVDIKSTGSYSIPLVAITGTTNGYLEFNVTNIDTYTNTNSKRYFEIENINIKEIDYTNYIS